MTKYRITFDRIGRNHNVAPISPTQPTPSSYQVTSAATRVRILSPAITTCSWTSTKALGSSPVECIWGASSPSE